MAAGGDQAYSTLEAVPHQPVYQTYRQEKRLPTDLGKQVASDDRKQYIVVGGGVNGVNGDFYAHDIGGHHVQVHQPSRRKWILFVGAVGLIAILAAVLGGVFGLRDTSSATVSPKRLSNSSAVSPSARPPQRNIAALSFSLNSVNNTRIYFQDDVGQIMEAATSAANTTWSINRTGIGGKNGSAIAAAVSRPDFPPVSQVFSMSIDSC